VIPRKGTLLHGLTVVLDYEIHGLVAECQCRKFIKGGWHIFLYSRGDVNIIIPLKLLQGLMGCIIVHTCKLVVDHFIM
jgi:hypothetical protein